MRSDRAERLAREHLVTAAAYMIGRLRQGAGAARVAGSSPFPAQ
jgi:hypothetical protein